MVYSRRPVNRVGLPTGISESTSLRVKLGTWQGVLVRVGRDLEVVVEIFWTEVVVRRSEQAFNETS